MPGKQQEMRDLKKPVLNTKEWELIDLALYHSMNDNAPVTLTMHDPHKEILYKGIVLQVDRQLMRIKLRWSDDDWDWVEMSEIVAATY
jgi:hypothetical protein